MFKTGGLVYPGKSVPFRLGCRTRYVHGGRYYDYPGKEAMFGVKMAVEIDMENSVSVPTHDFSTPRVSDLQHGIRETLWAMAWGQPVYVGCMGGIGRTGLFLAALAKTLGEEDPVAWVRANYRASAVETSGQKEFIRTFDTRPLQLTASAAALVSSMVFWN